MHPRSFDHVAIRGISSLVERAQAGCQYYLFDLLSVAVHDQLFAIRQQHPRARLQPARLPGQLLHHLQPDHHLPSLIYRLLPEVNVFLSLDRSPSLMVVVKQQVWLSSSRNFHSGATRLRRNMLQRYSKDIDNAIR